MLIVGVMQKMCISKKTSDFPVDELRNIGKKLARRLNEIGVYTKRDLSHMGAVEAHRRIKARYPGETLSICYYLYSFEGAIIDKHWDAIPEQRKAALKQAIEEEGS